MSLSEPPQPAVSWDVLDRYLAGECTNAAEKAAVHAYLARVENAENLLKHASRLADRPQTPPSSVEGWNALAIRLNTDPSQHTFSLEASFIAHERGVRTLSSGGFKAQPLRRAPRFLAAFILPVCVLVGMWLLGTRHSRDHTPRSMLTYATGNGQRATITLPDGGTVVLNVASRLEVPLDYMAGNRTVRLSGEGLFTVPHRNGVPFTVNAGGTATRVLGTIFVVRRYATDTATLVAVREGKVAVGADVVTAAHAVEVGRTGVKHARVSDGTPFTFATGVLTLNGVPLRTAIVELDRWYDADIRLGSPDVATHQIKGEFTAGSLGELSEDLEEALAVRVVRDGRILTLYPRR